MSEENQPTENPKAEKKDELNNPIFSYTLGGITFFTCTVVIGIGLDKVMGFWDTPSWAMVFGITISVMLAGGGMPRVVALPRYYAGQIASIYEAKQAYELFSIGINAAFLSGIFSTLLGHINMLSSGMDDPVAITQGVGLSLLTCFYGIALALLLMVGQLRAKRMLFKMQAEEAGADMTCFDPVCADNEPPYDGVMAGHRGWIIVASVVILQAIFTYVFLTQQDASRPRLKIYNNSGIDLTLSGYVISKDDSSSYQHRIRSRDISSSSDGFREINVHSDIDDILEKVASGKASMNVNLIVNDYTGKIHKEIRLPWPVGQREFKINLSDYLDKLQKDTEKSEVVAPLEGAR